VRSSLNKQYNKRALSHTGHLEVEITCRVMHLAQGKPNVRTDRIPETYSEQKRWPHIVTVGTRPTVGGASHILHCRESGVEAVTTSVA